ncbi:MAG: hypothetical protein ACYS7Y_33485 [Planctomycetota bacterium]|jgi:hypothetical protein
MSKFIDTLKRDIEHRLKGQHRSGELYQHARRCFGEICEAYKGLRSEHLGNKTELMALVRRPGLSPSLGFSRWEPVLTVTHDACRPNVVQITEHGRGGINIVDCIHPTAIEHCIREAVTEFVTTHLLDTR